MVTVEGYMDGTKKVTFEGYMYTVQQGQYSDGLLWNNIGMVQRRLLLGDMGTVQ